MLRNLWNDLKDFPATMALGAAWVILFGWMVLASFGSPYPPTIAQILYKNVGGAHRFGDMTLAELYRGELWRTVTCTFVHYNILHIGMNLYGLYQLGCLVESWYGSAQFVSIYLLIGGGGNLLSGLIRRALGSNPEIHSGGGSTVVLGLVALCAIVGWRSKTRVGDYLRRQMVGILLLTALLGMALPIIDNWGHAGGALVGAAIGFAHRLLTNARTSVAARWGGGVALAILLACGAAQLRDDRVESRLRNRLASAQAESKQAELIEANLHAINTFYRLASNRSDFEHSTFVSKSVWAARSRPPKGNQVPESWLILNLSGREFQDALARTLAVLDATRPWLGTGATENDFVRLRSLLAHVLDRPPTQSAAREFQFHSAAREFQFHWNALLRHARQNRTDAQAQREALERQVRAR
jgi:membrane associated rhomboid family serine protease